MITTTLHHDATNTLMMFSMNYYMNIWPLFDVLYELLYNECFITHFTI